MDRDYISYKFWKRLFEQTKNLCHKVPYPNSNSNNRKSCIIKVWYQLTSSSLLFITTYYFNVWHQYLCYVTLRCYYIVLTIKLTYIIKILILILCAIKIYTWPNIWEMQLYYYIIYFNIFSFLIIFYLNSWEHNFFCASPWDDWNPWDEPLVYIWTCVSLCTVDLTWCCGL